MRRDEVLSTALELTTGDRFSEYGPPLDNLTRIADLWSVAFDRTFRPEEVAIAMILVKVARLSNGYSADSWVDIAGYAGIGAEVDGRQHG